MSYRDAFRPWSRVSLGEKKPRPVSKKSGKHSNGKNFYKRISNYIKTCSTTPNTDKFAWVKGWAKKHRRSIARDHTTGRFIKTRSNKILLETWQVLTKFYTKIEDIKPQLESTFVSQKNWKRVVVVYYLQRFNTQVRGHIWNSRSTE